MSNSGAVTLGDIADRLPMLDVACSKCERRGRLSVLKLIERHGADAKLPDLREVLAGDCPGVGATSIYDRCGVHYPQLLAHQKKSPAPLRGSSRPLPGPWGEGSREDRNQV